MSAAKMGGFKPNWGASLWSMQPGGSFVFLWQKTRGDDTGLFTFDVFCNWLATNKTTKRQWTQNGPQHLAGNGASAMYHCRKPLIISRSVNA